MTRVVVFTSNNARVVYTEDYSVLQQNFTCAINPDLSNLKGVPPHFWKFKDGGVVEMTLDEKQYVLQDHLVHGIDNHLEPKKEVVPVLVPVLVPKIPKKSIIPSIVVFICSIATAATIVLWYFKCK